MSQNTKIEYLYRDADNYKVWNECVIKGELTEEQQKAILACLDSGEYFIPAQVGLPENRFANWDEQSDHPWFELGECSFTPIFISPTVDISAEQLVKAFEEAKDNWQPEFSTCPKKKTSSLDFLIQEATKRSKASVSGPETPAIAKPSLDCER